jgi:hypothetical protein
MAAAFWWVSTNTSLDFAELTFPQVECLMHDGKPPDPYRRTFRSAAEARAWAAGTKARDADDER